MILEFVDLKFWKWKNTNYKCWFSPCVVLGLFLLLFGVWGLFGFGLFQLRIKSSFLVEGDPTCSPTELKVKSLYVSWKSCFICPWYHSCSNVMQKNFFQWLHNNNTQLSTMALVALFFPSNCYNVNYAYDSRAQGQKASQNHYHQTLLEGIWNTTKLLDRKLKFCIP